VGLDVGNMDRASFEDGPSRRAGASWRDRRTLHEIPHLRGDVLNRPRAKDVAVETVDQCTLRLAQPHGILRKRIEDGLKVERGPADNLQQLTGRGLRLQRPTE